MQVGDKVKKGDVLCIVESMKMFNNIEAELEGTIAAVCVDNGQIVEFVSPWFASCPGKGGKLMNQEEIKKILPHRDHMLLIDEAELREGKAYGKKTIRGDEFFLQGHFPGNPVVPGVILCEILGQSACVLLSGEAEGITPFFTGLDKVRFKNPVHPGDVFETECTLLKHKGPFYWAEGKGYVDGKLCVSAEFSFALIKE